MLPTRLEAQDILKTHVKDEYQVLHSNMVALAMEAWAIKLNKSPKEIDLWYITGLLHDIDYFEFPDQHPNESLKWFKEWNYPEELISAVAEHAPERTGVQISTLLGAALTSCDELSGFLYAYSLMRPTKWEGMDYAGVKKRLKDKAFAAKINRNDIEEGIKKFSEFLAVNIDDLKKTHIELLIDIFSKTQIG